MCECRELGLAVHVGGNQYVCEHNSLAINYPEIAKEWHKTKNNGIDPMYVCKGSGKKRWWECQYCDYEWEIAVGERTRDRNKSNGCPRCTGKYTETVDKTHPHLLEECHEDDKWKLYKLTAGSTQSIKWKCKICTYIWYATLNSRTNPNRKNNGNGCPSCAGRYLQTVDKTHSHLLEECHNDDIWKLHSFTAGSVEIVRWKCKICDYMWSGTIASRASAGHGCQKCAGYYFETVDKTHHHLLDECYPDDKWKLYKLTAGSHEIIKWICRKNRDHTWTTMICTRVGGAGCPKCKRSKGEEACEEILKKNNVLYDTQYHIQELLNRAYDFIFLYSIFRILTEYDGEQHFMHVNHFNEHDYNNFLESQEIDRLKTRKALEAGYKLIRICYKVMREGSFEWHMNRAVHFFMTTNDNLYLSHPEEYQYLRQN